MITRGRENSCNVLTYSRIPPLHTSDLCHLALGYDVQESQQKGGEQDGQTTAESCAALAIAS
jgi:hypothetical protein